MCVGVIIVGAQPFQRMLEHHQTIRHHVICAYDNHRKCTCENSLLVSHYAHISFQTTHLGGLKFGFTGEKKYLEMLARKIQMCAKYRYIV